MLIYFTYLKKQQPNSHGNAKEGPEQLKYKYLSLWPAAKLTLHNLTSEQIIVTKIKTVGIVGRSIKRKHGTVESPESSRWGSEQLIFDTGNKVIHRER